MDTSELQGRPAAAEGLVILFIVSLRFQESTPLSTNMGETLVLLSSLTIAINDRHVGTSTQRQEGDIGSLRPTFPPKLHVLTAPPPLIG